MYDASLLLQDNVYFCLSPCGWCNIREGDGAAVWKYLSLLKEFQAAAVSMAHKRHLHQAQGVYVGFKKWHKDARGEYQPDRGSHGQVRWFFIIGIYSECKRNICLRSVEKQKPKSTPCAWCKCLLWAIDTAAIWNSLSKLRYFQPAAPSPSRVLHQSQGDKPK